MYIYDLPYSVTRSVCQILDANNKYEELATHMHYDTDFIQTLKWEILKDRSPTDKLLLLWGTENHAVIELFALLRRMKQYRAMTLLKDHVDPRYHIWLTEGETVLPEVAEPAPQQRCNDGKKVLNTDPTEYTSEEDNTKVEGVGKSGVKPKLAVPKPPAPNQPGPSKMVASAAQATAESVSSMPQIPYSELQESTNNWDNAAILGRGGFGTVFKGTWKCTKVAIKRIEQKDNNPDAHAEQITELRILNAYRHDNVLPLYGYSIGGPHPCLVYQYMCGGSLEYRLRVNDPERLLRWPSRLNVAVGTARGLQFLHTIKDKPLIHGDIKSANILLDLNDVPRIGDFGLAREGPPSQYTHIKLTKVHGTLPYLPDEFLRGKKFSTKVDTYSFGVVLFELTTGLGAYSDKREHKFLRDHVVDFEGDELLLKDKRVPDHDNIFKGLLDMGKSCTSRRPKDRPEMVAVLIQLEKVAGIK